MSIGTEPTTPAERRWGWFLAAAAPAALWPLWQWQAAGAGAQPPLAATLAGLILALGAATAPSTGLAE
ncbi:MAG TPA: hypothetical protein PKC18_04260, partial [Lacipirellulaceae bacterium]|nr:hypothetical protein [Lacipirellulaceae bacterium]